MKISEIIREAVKNELMREREKMIMNEGLREARARQGVRTRSTTITEERKEWVRVLENLLNQVDNNRGVLGFVINKPEGQEFFCNEEHWTHLETEETE
jgi:hypothetical protein